jgi:carbon storage regulator
MLVIRCREGETVRIGDDVEITLLAVSARRAKLGVTAPQRVRVARKGAELTRAQNIVSAQLEPAEMLRVLSRCMLAPETSKNCEKNGAGD